MKFRDVLKNDENLYARFLAIEKKLKDSILRNLGKNDAIHCKNIESIIDRLIPDITKTDEQVFDLGEIFLLLASIYLHDIGRTTSNSNHELESAKMVRRDYALYYLDKFEGEAVAQICAAHASETAYPIANCDPSFSYLNISSSTRDFNLQTLGAILRLADELDNFSSRVNGISGQANSARLAIRGISAKYEIGIIEIQSSPDSYEEYLALKNIVQYTQTRLDEIRNYLAPAKLSYYRIVLKPERYKPTVRLDAEKIATSEFSDLLFNILKEQYTDVKRDVCLDDIQLSALCLDKKFGIEIKVAYIIAEQFRQQYVQALASLKKDNVISAGVVITLRQLNRALLDDCKDIGIPVIESKSYIYRWLGLFESCSNLVKYLSEFLPKYTMPIMGVSTQSVSNVDKLLEDWLNGENRQLWIIGSKGSGKTTTCKSFEYRLAKKICDGMDDTRFPLYIPLRTISSDTSFEMFVLEALRSIHNTNMNIETFKSLNRSGYFVLIFDGIDEMDASVNLPVFFDFINSINDSHSKIVIVSNERFYDTKIKNIGSIKADAHIYLQGLTRFEIEEYISSHNINYTGLAAESIIGEFTSVSPLILRLLEMAIIKIQDGSKKGKEQHSTEVVNMINSYIRKGNSKE